MREELLSVLNLKYQCCPGQLSRIFGTWWTWCVLFPARKSDTTLCLQKMAANLNQKVVLPGTIQPNVFPNLAWDNVDRSEGTTYRVNGIALTQGIRAITPQNTASSYQQTKAEDRRAGSSASSRIHPRRQGRTTALFNQFSTFYP